MLALERDIKMKVRYNDCTDTQANWGRGVDPRPILQEGQEYEVDRTETHTWHTLYFLKGFAKPFNSVCFTEIEN